MTNRPPAISTIACPAPDAGGDVAAELSAAAGTDADTGAEVVPAEEEPEGALAEAAGFSPASGALLPQPDDPTSPRSTAVAG
ncbi:MAG TPA: hypothetical protein VNH84_14255, partial [Candidatus Saccharimonadales bacterium]|nr:hypothetical protein [Candidatus Saccharimonadales bacterium]